jgi:hypothetical protein
MFPLLSLECADRSPQCRSSIQLTEVEAAADRPKGARPPHSKELPYSRELN